MSTFNNVQTVGPCEPRPSVRPYSATKRCNRPLMGQGNFFKKYWLYVDKANNPYRTRVRGCDFFHQSDKKPRAARGITHFARVHRFQTLLFHRLQQQFHAIPTPSTKPLKQTLKFNEIKNAPDVFQ